MPSVIFFRAFFGTEILDGFVTFFVEKIKSAKCEKVCFVLVFAYFRKGRHVEKKEQTFPKTKPKDIDFLIKKVAKMDKKSKEK